MAERWTLTFEPLKGSIPPAIRLRWLLKFARRSLRLRCTSLADPIAAAWSGWRWTGAAWRCTCTGSTPGIVAALLSEAPTACWMVLPTGTEPPALMTPRERKDV